MWLGCARHHDIPIATTQPFAPSWFTLNVMSKTPAKSEPILNAIARSSERSSLFWWLSDQHDEILAAAAGRRIQWAPLISRFAELDLRDGEGKPVTARTASDTWAEVKRTIAERQAMKAAAQARNQHPSRLPATWRPTPVEPPQTAMTPRYAPPNTAPASTAPIELSEKARRTMAALDRQLDYRDRFVRPPTRKD